MSRRHDKATYQNHRGSIQIGDALISLDGLGIVSVTLAEGGLRNDAV